MNPIASRRNAKKVIVLLLLGFCSPSPDNIFVKKFIYTSGCGGCDGAGLPPKPVDVPNDGVSNDAANKPYTPPPEPASVAKASTPVGTGGFMTTTSASAPSFDTPSFSASVSSGFGGKPAPTQPDHPEV